MIHHGPDVQKSRQLSDWVSSFTTVLTTPLGPIQLLPVAIMVDVSAIISIFSKPKLSVSGPRSNG